jgi:Pretoxin HINT domain
MGLALDARCCSREFPRSLARKWSLVLGVTVALTGPTQGASTDSTTKTEAERLIAAAAHAEISGNIPQSIALLHDAIRVDRENRLAHWQLGEVQINKQWVRVEEAQQRAAGDRQQAEYRERRSAATDSLQDQWALAKWCRKNSLVDEARFHWANVLAADPNNEDALRALDMRWHRGRLLPTSEIAAIKKGDGARRREQLAASVAKWRNAFAGKGKMSQSEALSEIRSIHDADAIPVIEELASRPDTATIRESQNGELTSEQIELRRQVGLAFVAALIPMSEQAATEALVRQAVWSPFSDVREVSTGELKKRPLYDYVPMLLAGLAMPVESSYHVETSSDGTVRYVHSLYQPGATADSELEIVDQARPRLTRTREDMTETLALTPKRVEKINKGMAKSERKFAARAAAVEANVASKNEFNSVGNQRIVAVLAATTDQKLGDDPRGWWSYWQNQNEYYVPPKQPVYQQVRTSEGTYCVSCFVKGTPIWTKTGRRPVESLEIGDLVLSKNVDTGELRYEPVIGRTLRPPSQVLKVSMDGGELTATKGHPFWVAGVGWRMTKELGDDAVLSGVRRAARVRSIEPAGEAEAYNLVVAEFNTYFVGESGILVHDNSPRRPTRALVPGVAKN